METPQIGTCKVRYLEVIYLMNESEMYIPKNCD